MHLLLFFCADLEIRFIDMRIEGKNKVSLVFSEHTEHIFRSGFGNGQPDAGIAVLKVDEIVIEIA